MPPMHTLKETIEIAGEWWLTDKPDTVIPGQLHFNSQGIELHLNQAFSLPTGSIRPGDPNPTYAAVHGVTIKGEAVTLFDAQQFGTSINSGTGGIKQPGKISARVLAFGAHLPPDFQFIKVRFRVPGLQVWLGQQVINHQILFDQDQKLLRQSYILGKIPDETFRISSIGALASWHYGWSSNADAFTSVKIDVSAWFSFQPDAGKSIDWFLAQHDTLLTMLSFLSGHPFVADAIQAEFDESNNQADILIVTRNAKAPEPRHLHDFFLNRIAITLPLEDYCNKWFELTPSVEKPASLARSVMASERLWLHMEFLSLMQALEGLHRSKFDGNYMADAQYETVRTELTNAIPTSVARDHRDSLRSRIKYGNQISLRKRLNELADMLPQESRVKILGQGATVPQSWIDTRNYYTHWDEELLSNVLNSQSMYYANVRMHHFIRILYSLLMGVPAQDIDRAFSLPSSIAQQLLEINIVEKRQADPSYVPQAIMTISSDGDRKDDSTSEIPTTD